MYYLTEKIRRDIGKNIKKFRKVRGLKQIEVSVDAGINSSYYGKIERGIVNPSVEKVYRIIKALKTSSKEIFPF